MAKFQTKITKARFSRSNFTPQHVAGIAQTLADSVRLRIQSGLDVSDNPAPPLKRPLRDLQSPRNVKNGLAQFPGKRYSGYPEAKIRAGAQPIRNWTYTGRTMRSLKVISASQNRAVIGFTDSVTQMRAAMNNRRWRQFGVSPRDRATLHLAIKAARAVKAKAA